MDLLLVVKDFLLSAKEAGTYNGNVEVGTIEKYADEEIKMLTERLAELQKEKDKGNYKNLEKMIVLTLRPAIYFDLQEKLKKIKETKDNEE